MPINIVPQRSAVKLSIAKGSITKLNAKRTPALTTKSRTNEKVPREMMERGNVIIPSIDFTKEPTVIQKPDHASIAISPVKVKPPI